MPEMLEAILFELPAKDLLFSRAVCKTFKACIDSSTKLQKALFLMPDGEVHSCLDGELATDRSHAEMLTHLEELIKGGPGIPPLRRNPLFEHHYNDFENGDILRNQGEVVLRGSKPGSHAIWKQMLLTQPPIRTHSIRVVYVGDGVYDEEYHQHYRFESSKGLTMGDFTRAFEKALVKKSNGARNAIIWSMHLESGLCVQE